METISGVLVSAKIRSDLHDEIQNLNQKKEDILGTISHELRTPLNVVLGHAEMLVKEKLDPFETHNAVCAIYRNAKLQKKILNEFLIEISSVFKGRFRKKKNRKSTIKYAIVRNFKFDRTDAYIKKAPWSLSYETKD